MAPLLSFCPCRSATSSRRDRSPVVARQSRMEFRRSSTAQSLHGESCKFAQVHLFFMPYTSRILQEPHLQGSTYGMPTSILSPSTRRLCGQPRRFMPNPHCVEPSVMPHSKRTLMLFLEANKQGITSTKTSPFAYSTRNEENKEWYFLKPEMVD